VTEKEAIATAEELFRRSVKSCAIWIAGFWEVERCVLRKTAFEKQLLHSGLQPGLGMHVGMSSISLHFGSIEEIHRFQARACLLSRTSCRYLHFLVCWSSPSVLPCLAGSSRDRRVTADGGVIDRRRKPTLR
jgi:hypothetical protein